MLKNTAIGNLVADPELKKVTVNSEEVDVCEFRIAANNRRTNKTEFISCVAWRGLAKTIGQYCQKGRKIFISGYQQTRDWEDQETKQKRYKTEWIIEDMEFCDSNKDSSSAPTTEVDPF